MMINEYHKVKSCYIHIPFCKNICSYCDFCKIYYNELTVDNYLDTLAKEIKSIYKNESLETVYIGGGTPSSLNKNQLEKLFSIINNLNLSDEYEFTFECNVEDITKELLLFLKKNGVNRLSIGVQSFNNKLLKILGRFYDFDIKEKIFLAKMYFQNINIDLIYGVNGQNLVDLKKDISEFLSVDVSHISIYSLILEDNTILKVNNYEEIEDSLNRKMYDYICNELKKNGYIHYEISNFAKKDYESRHNLTYWNNDKYYGFGLGASGYIGDIRYTNTRSMKNYINGKYVYNKELIDTRIDMENFMILGLRKLEGISNKSFYDRYGKNIKEVFNVSKLSYKSGNFYIDESNLYISNQILCDFIDIDYLGDDCN